MRHRVAGKKLGRTTSHRIAMTRNMYCGETVLVHQLRETHVARRIINRVTAQNEERLHRATTNGFGQLTELLKTVGATVPRGRYMRDRAPAWGVVAQRIVEVMPERVHPCRLTTAHQDGAVTTVGRELGRESPIQGFGHGGLRHFLACHSPCLQDGTFPPADLEAGRTGTSIRG